MSVEEKKAEEEKEFQNSFLSNTNINKEKYEEEQKEEKEKKNNNSNEEIEDKRNILLSKKEERENNQDQLPENNKNIFNNLNDSNIGKSNKDNQNDNFKVSQNSIFDNNISQENSQNNIINTPNTIFSFGCEVGGKEKSQFQNLTGKNILFKEKKKKASKQNQNINKDTKINEGREVPNTQNNFIQSSNQNILDKDKNKTLFGGYFEQYNRGEYSKILFKNNEEDVKTFETSFRDKEKNNALFNPQNKGNLFSENNNIFDNEGIKDQEKEEINKQKIIINPQNKFLSNTTKIQENNNNIENENKSKDEGLKFNNIVSLSLQNTGSIGNFTLDELNKDNKKSEGKNNIFENINIAKEQNNINDDINTDEDEFEEENEKSDDIDSISNEESGNNNNDDIDENIEEIKKMENGKDESLVNKSGKLFKRNKNDNTVNIFEKNQIKDLTKEKNGQKRKRRKRKQRKHRKKGKK